VAFQKRGQRQVDRKEQKGLNHEVKWRHPGGKLREFGPESLSDVELVAILISLVSKASPLKRLPMRSLPNSARSRE